jgi:hypothetical protein
LGSADIFFFLPEFTTFGDDGHLPVAGMAKGGEEAKLVMTVRKTATSAKVYVHEANKGKC